MKKMNLILLAMALFAAEGLAHAEMRRVCEGSLGCRYLPVSTACRGGVDQYSGEPCVYGDRSEIPAPERSAGCGPGGVNEYTGRPC